MKKMIFFLMVMGLSSLAIADNDLSQKTSQAQQYKRVEGSTIISNMTNQKLRIQWQTSLSNTIKSAVQSQNIPPNTKNFKSSEEVEWFEQHNKESINPLVYVLDVKVYDIGGSLLSEEQVKITRSYQSLTDEHAKNNLHIVVHKNYTIDYSLI